MLDVIRDLRSRINIVYKWEKDFRHRVTIESLLAMSTIDKMFDTV